LGRRARLVVVAAATATAVAATTTTAATTAATTATATAASAAAAAAATTAAAVAATAAATAAALGLTRLVDDDGAAAERLPVELVDRRLCLAVVGHFDERESAWSSGIAIGDDLYLPNLSCASTLEKLLD
jgi:hypothetical protein